MFTTHEANIPQIKATINAFGKCWFHGDGNLYSEKEDSDFRQGFSNPKNENSQYRILFTNVSQVPDSKEALDKMLLESRAKEIVDSRVSSTISPVKTVKVETDPEPTLPVGPVDPIDPPSDPNEDETGKGKKTKK